MTHKFVGLIPGGLDSPVIDHNLGTKDIASCLALSESSGRAMLMDWSVLNENQVRLSLRARIAEGTYRVVITG